MAGIVADRIKRSLNEVEGFLMLGLPGKALEVLQAHADWATMKFEADFLSGEALRRARPLPRGDHTLGIRRRHETRRHRGRAGFGLVLQTDS